MKELIAGQDAIPFDARAIEILRAHRDTLSIIPKFQVK
jgi:hypothetical protein